MNSCQKYFSACLLALFSQAAFAQAPELRTASSFAVLSAADDGGGAVTCTNSAIVGDVGSTGLLASVVETECAISGAIIAPVDGQVVKDFDSAYDQYATISCTGSLAAAYTGATLTLTPGVYCSAAGVAFTNTTLILDGDANAVWIFKIGTDGTGALTGTNFSVVMANDALACNVYWWVAEAATLTTSNFKGTILAGAAITVSGGTFAGRTLAKAAVTLKEGVAAIGCSGGTFNPPQQRCNQGVGNGPEEGCDPGNSNRGNPFRSNDELGGTPGNPGRSKGGNK